MADGIAGLVGGAMGGIGGLSGPAPTLWCTLRHWSRDAQRAVIQSFNLAMHALTLTVYAVDGAITAETGRMFAVIAPTLVVPCLIGAAAHTAGSARSSSAGWCWACCSFRVSGCWRPPEVRHWRCYFNGQASSAGDECALFQFGRPRPSR